MATGTGAGRSTPWHNTETPCLATLLLCHWMRVVWFTSTSCRLLVDITAPSVRMSCLGLR